MDLVHAIAAIVGAIVPIVGWTIVAIRKAASREDVDKKVHELRDEWRHDSEVLHKRLEDRVSQAVFDAHLKRLESSIASLRDDVKEVRRMLEQLIQREAH